jgi:serine/threonine-protein kinase
VIVSPLLHDRILHTLGAGSMGEVYAAEDSRLNRRIALKLLRPETAGDPERLHRFRREAQSDRSGIHRFTGFHGSMDS